MTENGRDIPEHVLFDILLWLPVVSLLRLKHTCKYWCVLIESSTFISEHLHRSNSNNKEALIVYGREVVDYKRGTSKALLMLIDGDEYKKCSKVYTQKLLPFGPYYRGLVGSCDGIICLRTNDVGNLALYNPTMKQLRHIAEPSFLTPPTVAASHYVIVGFGFDSKTNDYKVVRILFYAEKRGRGYNNKIVEVYSKRTDSWRTSHKTCASLPFAVLFRYPHTTSKNGTCFWLGEEVEGSWTFNLVSFDLDDEVFGAMPLPDKGKLDQPCALDFLNDNLICIMAVGRANTYEPGHECFEIWMLQEFGIKESWNKIYKIGPIPKLRAASVESHYPIRLSKSGKFIILMQRRFFNKHGNWGELSLFNLRTQEKKYPRILPHNCWASEVFNYVESLVSVKS